MSGGFSNPVLGAGGALVRNSAHSPNYVANTSGWTINQDGSAEFNSVTVRGPVQVIGSDGSYVYVQTSAGTAVIVLEPATQPGFTWTPGSIATESNGLSGSADLVITSPQQQGSAGGTSQIVLEGADGSRSTSLITLSAADVNMGGTLSGGLPYVLKSADETISNSTALQNDDELAFALAANALYELRLYIACASPTAASIKTSWSTPAGSTGVKHCVGPTSVVADGGNRGDTKMRLQMSTTLSTSIVYCPDATLPTVVQETGLISTAGTAGNVTLQWAQTSAVVGSTTVFAGSYAILRRLA